MQSIGYHKDYGIKPKDKCFTRLNSAGHNVYTSVYPNGKRGLVFSRTI